MEGEKKCPVCDNDENECTCDATEPTEETVGSE